MSFTLMSQPNDTTWLYDWNTRTVSIGKIDTIKISENGKIKLKPYFNSIGTGVIFYVKFENTLTIPCIVSAKHVFEDSLHKWNPKKIRIRYSVSANNSVFSDFGIEIKLFDKKQKVWYSHPDSRVDLACLPLAPKDGPNYIRIMPYSAIANDNQLYVGASIFVYGYPNAVGLDYLNKPLLRSGIIAWLPSGEQSQNKILIDCPIYPGNSGGPVFLSPVSVSPDGGFQTNDVKFIGIVTERRFSESDIYLIQKEMKPALAQDSLGNKLISLESIGIGVIEPASKVRELLLYVQKNLH